MLVLPMAQQALVAGRAPPATSFFGARFRHAIVNAPFSVAASAAASRTRVQPRSPQRPGAGTKTSGVVSISSACWSGLSPSTPHAASGWPKVAKILAPTRKSAVPMCAPSRAPGSDSAMRRNWLAGTSGSGS